MEWFFHKRRGPEWKHGWTGQTLNNISTPPLPLLAIFAIVILLWSLSNYTSYKAQLYQTTNNFQLFLFLLPILFIFLIASSSSDGRPSFRLQIHIMSPITELAAFLGVLLSWWGASCLGLLPICISIKVVWSSQEFCLVKETPVLSTYDNKDALLVIVRQVNVHILGLIMVSIEFLFWVL
ncbi:hypothetical protein AAG906_019613 [Vitis piasezkii]